MKNKPELLAPAGSPEALAAAVSAGADAVYFGTGSHNARINAKNFTPDEVGNAVALCHAHGAAAHVTLNTQVYDRELKDALKCAESVIRAGSDALIVADLGLAGLLRKYFPDTPLHASTQCSGASVRDAEYFASLGFTRMVCARELSADDVKRLCASSPIEIEMFVHGAICVSASGQCLFSSVVGGRSGNRGECAQPCRLPYSGGYPLSPKDLCLAGHMREVVATGVSSLKIEGRMKSPEYVYRTVSLYRRLIDEGRDADASEIKALGDSFSRSGFTDAYFTHDVKQHPNRMLGVRTETDKERSRISSSVTEIPMPEKVPIGRVGAVFRVGEPSVLSLTSAGRTVTVAGDAAEAAGSRGITVGELRERLSKFGGTPFTVNAETVFDIEICGGDAEKNGIFLPVSAINGLRRRGVGALLKRRADIPPLPDDPIPERAAVTPTRLTKTAEFLRPAGITPLSREYFDTIYLPLETYDKIADGFLLPPVVYDSEADEVRRMAEAAVSRGARACVISNAGQLKLIDGLPLEVTAGFRFNICNTESALEAKRAGVPLAVISPELTASQMRDIAHHVRAGVIVYGRLPLMVTERCIMRAVSGDKCICGDDQVCLSDRRGVRFPIYKGYGCRTVIYNSVPVYMADREDVLRTLGASAHHFIFTTEGPDEVDDVIRRYESKAAAAGQIRRIK